MANRDTERQVVRPARRHPRAVPGKAIDLWKSLAAPTLRHGDTGPIVVVKGGLGPGRIIAGMKGPRSNQRHHVGRRPRRCASGGHRDGDENHEAASRHLGVGQRPATLLNIVNRRSTATVL